MSGKDSNNNSVAYLRVRCTKPEDVLILERFFNFCDDERYRYREITLDLINEWTRKKYAEVHGIEESNRFFGSGDELESNINLDLEG